MDITTLDYLIDELGTIELIIARYTNTRWERHHLSTITRTEGSGRLGPSYTAEAPSMSIYILNGSPGSIHYNYNSQQMANALHVGLFRFGHITSIMQIKAKIAIKQNNNNVNP